MATNQTTAPADSTYDQTVAKLQEVKDAKEIAQPTQAYEDETPLHYSEVTDKELLRKMQQNYLPGFPEHKAISERIQEL